MLQTLKTYVSKNWTLKKATGHFEQANYGSVLKSVTATHLRQDDWAARLNIFRLIALKETGNDDWLSELGTLNQHGWLNGFAQDEKNYILIYLLDRLFGEIDISPTINLAKVSDELRALFPVDPGEAKFHIFFYQPENAPRRFKPENYIWLSRPKPAPRTVIRFPTNLENMKTFSLSKGPWIS